MQQQRQISKYNFDERSQTQYTCCVIVFKWTSSAAKADL